MSNAARKLRRPERPAQVFRYWIFPDEITVTNPLNGEPARRPDGELDTWDALRYAVDFALAAAEAGGMQTVRDAAIAALETLTVIKEAFANEQGYVKLTDAQWRMLCAAHQSNQWQHRLGRQGPMHLAVLIPFMRSLDDAKTEEPELEDEEPKDGDEDSDDAETTPPAPSSNGEAQVAQDAS